MSKETAFPSSARRSLGRTGIEVSSVGIGTWAMGAEWGTQQDQESIAALHQALDMGCRLLDTAQVYGQGRSEQLIGRVLKERGERVPLANIGAADGRHLGDHPWRHQYSREVPGHLSDRTM